MTYTFDKLVRNPETFDGFPVSFTFAGGPHDGKPVMFKTAGALLSRIRFA